MRMSLCERGVVCALFPNYYTLQVCSGLCQLLHGCKVVCKVLASRFRRRGFGDLPKTFTQYDVTSRELAPHKLLQVPQLWPCARRCLRSWGGHRGP